MNNIGAWLHMTDGCNLRCRYCHLPHHPVEMPIEIALASIDTIFRVTKKYGFLSTHIKYMGGEPLLQLDNIVIISNYPKNWQKKIKLNWMN